MSGRPALSASQGYPGESSRQHVRFAFCQPKGANDETWAPKWQELLKHGRRAPADFTSFDRIIRSLLNRISNENARRLLPSNNVLNEKGQPGWDDYPHWWVARFAALMMTSYLQVIHTNRFARGFAVRSADNILPTYIDAVAPLLVQSPRLVTAVTSWLAEELGWHEIAWPTTRLVLLAAHDKRDRTALPASSLGVLPAHLLQRRILSFLHPPFPISSKLRAELSNSSDDKNSELIERKKDIIAVLVHLVVFAPDAIWPQVSAFAFALAEISLRSLESQQEVQVQDYLAASVLGAIAQHMEQLSMSTDPDGRAHSLQDLGTLNSLISRLHDITEVRRMSSKLTQFVDCRTRFALERARRVQESFERHDMIPLAAT